MISQEVREKNNLCYSKFYLILYSYLWPSEPQSRSFVTIRKSRLIEQMTSDKTSLELAKSTMVSRTTHVQESKRPILLRSNKGKYFTDTSYTPHSTFHRIWNHYPRNFTKTICKYYSNRHHRNMIEHDAKNILRRKLNGASEKGLNAACTISEVCAQFHFTESKKAFFYCGHQQDLKICWETKFPRRLAAADFLDKQTGSNVG